MQNPQKIVIFAVEKTIVKQILKVMRVVNHSDLAHNVDKYLDMASQEDLYISRGPGELFMLVKREYHDPDSDLMRGLTADEILPSIVSDVRELYMSKHKG